MPSLDPVTQTITADTVPYIDAIDAAIAVTEEFAGAVADALEAVEALAAAIAALPDEKTIRINVETTGGVPGGVGNSGLSGMAGQAQEATNAVRDLGVAWTKEEAAQKAATAAAEAFGRDALRAEADFDNFMRDRLQASIDNLQYDMDLQANGVEKSALAWREYADTLRYNSADLARLGINFGGAKQAIDQTTGAVDNANRAWGVQVGWFRITANALHWIVAGSLEFLAVAVPAAVALGAGLLVAAQGAQTAQQHFSALYNATESTYSAFHQTVGSVVGLGSALQNAQNAANPGVYEILGSVINDAKTRFADLANTGLQVVHMFDEFSARVTVDLQGAFGSQLHGLLAGMVNDLQQLGQVLGHLGAAFLNWAAAMPGLAHYLLDIANALSTVILWASRGGVFLTVAMGLEEVYRWGGLALSMLVRMTGQMALMNSMGATGFITRFGAAVLTLTTLLAQGLTSLGSWIARLGEAGSIVGRFGGALQGAGARLEAFAQATSPAMIAGWAAFAAGVFAAGVAFDSLRNSAQKTIDTTNQAISSAKDMGTAMTAMSTGISKASLQIAQQQHILGSYSAAQQLAGMETGRFINWLQQTAGPIGGFAQGVQNAANSQSALARHSMFMIGVAGLAVGAWNLFAGGASQAASKIDELRAAEQQWAAQGASMVTNAGTLAHQFGTSLPAAFAMASAAGVNLIGVWGRNSAAMKIADMQVRNYLTGIGAMGAGTGVIGADMQAMAVQSALASSKVAQVSQAMDAFIAGTTGGMNSVMQFNAALHAMGNDTASSSQSITGAITRISHTAAQMGYTLQGFGPRAQQSWQQFDAAVQQGNATLDTFRTGMAEGVVSASQYQNEIKAVGGSLLPFAAHSRTALAITSQIAQEMGFPATHSLKTLAAEFGITGRAAQNMATTGMEQAIARMANLNVIARNLSVTIGSQLDAAMSKAIVGASGMQTAYNKWASDAAHNKGPQVLQSDLKGIANAQNTLNTLQLKGTTMLNAATSGELKHVAALAAAESGMTKLATETGSATAKIAAHITKVDQAASASTAMASKTAMLSTNLGTNAAKAQGAASAIQRQGQQASTAAGDMQRLGSQTGTAGGAALTASGKMSQLAGAIQHAGSMAATATGQVQALASAIASLQSKTITITTNMVTATVHRQHGGPVLPGVPAIVGEAGRELFMPATPGYVVPHEQTERILGGAAGGQATGAHPTVIHLEHTTHVQAVVDQGVLFEAVKTDTAVYGRRNGTWQQGVLAPARN